MDFTSKDPALTIYIVSKRDKKLIRISDVMDVL